MPWAKLDDRFHDNRKVRRVWKQCPEALGLHVLALTHCAANLTDGLVDHEFVEERAARAALRDRMTGALVDAGLWHVADGGWLIHDYHGFNPTREQVLAKRLARQNAGRVGGIASASKRQANAQANRKQTVDVCFDTVPTPVPEPVPNVKANSTVEPSSTATQMRSAVVECFGYWQDRCDHHQAQLDGTRRRLLEARLRDRRAHHDGDLHAAIRDVRLAIDGAARAPFVNEQGKRFDDLTLICRSVAKLEDFMGRASLPAQAPASAGTVTRRRRPNASDMLRALDGGAA